MISSRLSTFLKKYSLYISIGLLSLFFIVALGIRFYHLGHNSMWSDEFWVAEKASQSIGQILTDNNPTIRAVPKLFVLSIKLVITIFGRNDFTLRFMPAFFSALSVVFFYLLLKRVTKNTLLTLFGTSLFAFNLRVLQYAQELKQYSGEVCTALILFYLTELYIEDTKHPRRSFLILLVASVIGIFFFFPTIILIPAIVFRIFIHYLIKEKRHWKESFNIHKKELIWLCIYSLVVVVLFCVDYFYFVPKPSDRLIDYWVGSFPRDLSFQSVYSFGFSRTFEFFTYLFNPKFYPLPVIHALPLLLPQVLAILCGVGILYAWSKRYYQFIWYGLIPGVCTFIAALLYKYPFGGRRVDLFLTPLIFVFIALGVFALLSFIKNKKVIAAILGVLIVASPLTVIFYNHFVYPSVVENIRDVVHWYQAGKQPGDYTYIQYAATGGVREYNGINTKDHMIVGNDYRQHLDRYDGALANLTKKLKGRRLWILMSRLVPNEQATVHQYIQKYCLIKSQLAEPGSYGLLVQC